MSTKKYRGLDIAAEQYEIAKNLNKLDTMIDDLRDLQSTWNNLSLLGELTNIGADIGLTRKSFQDLSGELSSCLIDQAIRSVSEGLGTKAQNSIDILTRNLYERSADIGFLSADPYLIEVCESHQNEGLNEQKIKEIRARMRRYTNKYSVYRNMVLLDAQCHPICDLLGDYSDFNRYDWVAEGVAQSDGFFETHRKFDRKIDLHNDLIYCWKVAQRGQIVGYVALIFDLHEESHSLFSKIIGHTPGQARSDWSVCGVADENNRILVSSDPSYVQPGHVLNLKAGQRWSVEQIGPVAYLGCMRTSEGFQGYKGPGWKGFCLLPLSQSFEDSATLEFGGSSIENITLESHLIDAKVPKIESEAAVIQKQLNRSVWNGNITQKTNKSSLGDTFSKALLWEISRAGAKTQKLFETTLKDMLQTTLSAEGLKLKSAATLAIDLMDRNLYERSNDCRWWAENPVFVHSLKNRDQQEQIDRAKTTLKQINDLYSVYSDILLIDDQGHIVCNSGSQNRVGTAVSTRWFRSAMTLKDTEKYCVSDFEATELYGGKPTYIYSAAIFENPDRPYKPLGVIALVFDCEPQFRAILSDALRCPTPGAVGLVLDQNLKVIASTDSQYEIGRPCGLNLNLSKNFEKGASSVHQIHIDNSIQALGMANSGQYREYKSKNDPYQNNLTCVYFAPVARPSHVEKQLKPISFEEFRGQGQESESIEVATFRVGDSWFGISTDAVIEAFIPGELAKWPASSPLIAGSVMYKNRAITVVNSKRLLTPHLTDDTVDIKNSQIVLIKPRKGTVIAGLAVEELGEIPNIPREYIQNNRDLLGENSVLDGLVKTSNNMLNLINHGALLECLHGADEEAYEEVIFYERSNPSQDISQPAISGPTELPREVTPSTLANRLDVSMS